MAFIDYYKVLGISNTANEKEIKAAYRKLARKYHPDVNPDNKNAETKFKEINEANEVLSSPENRKKYDTHGKNWKHEQEYEKARQQQQAQSNSGERAFTEQEYSSFFESMFGGRTSSSRQGQYPKFKGQDYHAELHVDLQEVYTTHKRVLTVNNKNIRLTIPAGIENGQEIKIPGKGGEGLNGGPHGDLFITFIIRNQTAFKRDGNTLYSSVNIDLYTALLGGEIMVDAFEGKVKLKIAAGTQNGTKVKLKGKGFPLYKNEGKFGDLIIIYNITIPTNLSKKELELFQELQKLR